MRPGRLVLGLVFIGAGVAHWTAARFFAAIVPDYLPAHRELVLASGVAAAVGGAALLLPATRRPAAWALVAWLIAVFPANLWMAQHPERYGQIPEWVLWARLPFQFVGIWWAYLYTGPDEGTSHP